MSLLLEALKKAERAKEEAQRRARGESASSSTSAAAAPAEPSTVVTRDKLPQITAPLEIVTDDLVSPPVAPVMFVMLTKKVSFGSGVVSPLTVTLTVVDVLPCAMLPEPLTMAT